MFNSAYGQQDPNQAAQMMAQLQLGGALQSDYFSVISKVSPHDQTFKYHHEIEEMGLYGI